MPAADMPEGPSIVILREESAHFDGQIVRRVTGNSSLDLSRMQGCRVESLRSWGKHFLIEFADFSMRVHLMLFGSYRIDDLKPAPARMSLSFDNGDLHFYNCSLRYIEVPLDQAYDWSADVMSDQWDPKAARAKLKAKPAMLACDALLDQSIFAGSGNIIKNEVLFRIRVHPCSSIGALPARKLTQLITEVRNYSFEFLEWKKAFVLRKHWLVHTKTECPRGHGRLTKAHLGTTRRRSFFCETCQALYGPGNGE